MSVDALLHEAEDKMGKSVEALNRDLTSIRTGRANPALIEKVMVPYYGTPTPLNSLAQISAPEPRLLVVQVFDRTQIAAVEKAIRTSELGLNPASDGAVIRVPIPPLTEERRREMVKHLHKTLEEHRTAIRNIRRDGNEAIKKALKDKKITEDEDKRATQEIQKLTDDEIKKMEDMCKAKEKEVMEIK